MCNVPTGYYQRVLVNCGRSQLGGPAGALVLCLAEFIDREPKWERLRFVINCIVGNKRDVMIYSFNVFIGNNLVRLFEIADDKRDIGNSNLAMADRLVFYSTDYYPAKSQLDLANPNSIEMACHTTGAIIDKVVAYQEQTGWSQYD